MISEAGIATGGFGGGFVSMDKGGVRGCSAARVSVQPTHTKKTKSLQPQSELFVNPLEKHGRHC
jgi:hypothetical protein